MTPDEAYGLLTVIGRLTDGLTKVEAQRDAALAEVRRLRDLVPTETAAPDGADVATTLPQPGGA